MFAARLLEPRRSVGTEAMMRARTPTCCALASRGRRIHNPVCIRSTSDLMDRIYLSVSPEEYAEVKASGACWDDASKRWYIGEGMAPATFSRWLGEDQGEAPFGLASEEAFVASARTSCVNCLEEIEVICIYCESGVDTEIGHALTRFTVSNIWAADGALRILLQRWPCYRPGIGEDAEQGNFANHCSHCGAMQEDYLLHSEPGDVFFGIALGSPEEVEFTPLAGRLQLSGDYGFEV
jgi:Domain of unknown function (DUF5710)